MENAELQEFDGTFVDYICIVGDEDRAAGTCGADMEEIERNRKIVERLRNEATKVDSATKGRSLKARVLCWSVSKRGKQNLRLWISNSLRLNCTPVQNHRMMCGDVSGQTDADETTSEEERNRIMKK